MQQQNGKAIGGRKTAQIRDQVSACLLRDEALEVEDIIPRLLAAESQARRAEGKCWNLGRLLGHEDFNTGARGH
jgi:hypothetical protein